MKKDKTLKTPKLKNAKKTLLKAKISSAAKVYIKPATMRGFFNYSV